MKKDLKIMETRIEERHWAIDDDYLVVPEMQVDSLEYKKGR